MKQKIEHIVASGCSQTSDGVGGIPLEACSFVSNHIDDVAAEPRSWVSIVAKQLGVTSLANFAADSHGNILIANSIIEALTKFDYPRDSTLVLFNVSWPNRLDVMCDWDHPDKSKFTPWSREQIPYSYLFKHSRSFKACEKTIGFDQIERMTWLSLTGLFNFLENQNFKYRFLLGGNFSHSAMLQELVNSRADNLIMLDPAYPSIAEFVCANNLNADQIHPTAEGHKIISNIVLKQLEKM